MTQPQTDEERIVSDAYARGYLDGLAAYAWWKDGVQYVGTTGRTLRAAQDAAVDTWNYTP